MDLLEIMERTYQFHFISLKNKIEYNYTPIMMLIMNDYHHFFVKMYLIKMLRDRAHAKDYFRNRARQRRLLL